MACWPWFYWQFMEQNWMLKISACAMICLWISFTWYTHGLCYLMKHTITRSFLSVSSIPSSNNVTCFAKSRCQCRKHLKIVLKCILFPNQQLHVQRCDYNLESFIKFQNCIYICDGSLESFILKFEIDCIFELWPHSSHVICDVGYMFFFPTKKVSNKCTLQVSRN